MTIASQSRWPVVRCALVAALLVSSCDQHPIVAPVLIVQPADTVSHKAGRFSAAEKAMVADPGETGFLVYGPYAVLDPGHYHVTFNLSVDGPAGIAGRVDVNAFTPTIPEAVAATADLGTKGADQKISLDFTVTPGLKYEFRVSTNGSATIRLLGIVVKKDQ